MAEDQFFTPGEYEANKTHKQELFDLVASEDSILMAGAGCSGAIYPSWFAFVEKMREACVQHAPDFNAATDDFLKFFNSAKDCLGDDRYYTFIHDEFKPREIKHLPFHETLCLLPFRGIITTNYDVVLESALAKACGITESSFFLEHANKKKIYEYFQSLNKNSGFPRKIFHIHGKFDINDTIVLCETEYSSKYGFSRKRPPSDSLYEEIQKGIISPEAFNNLLVGFGYEWPIRRKILWSLLSTRRMVFIGFSMSDPYFQKMFEHVTSDLNAFGCNTHYLVLRTTTETKADDMAYARMLKDSYGIETVFFRDDDTYKGLENFVAEMGSQILPPSTSEPKETTAPVAVPVTGDDVITEKLFALSAKQIEHGN